MNKKAATLMFDLFAYTKLTNKLRPNISLIGPCTKKIIASLKIQLKQECQAKQKMRLY